MKRCFRQTQSRGKKVVRAAGLSKSVSSITQYDISVSPRNHECLPGWQMVCSRLFKTNNFYITAYLPVTNIQGLQVLNRILRLDVCGVAAKKFKTFQHNDNHLFLTLKPWSHKHWQILFEVEVSGTKTLWKKLSS